MRDHVVTLKFFVHEDDGLRPVESTIPNLYSKDAAESKAKRLNERYNEDYTVRPATPAEYQDFR